MQLRRPICTSVMIVAGVGVVARTVVAVPTRARYPSRVFLDVLGTVCTLISKQSTTRIYEVTLLR